MIRKVKILSVLLVSVFLTACAEDAKTETKLPKKNPVEAVIDEQVKKLEEEEKKASGDRKNTSDGTEFEGVEGSVPDGGSFAAQIGAEEFREMLDKARNQQGNGDIDIDLTKMDSDMVYATVFLLMTEPETYVGKKIRMRGQYLASFYEPNGNTYSYCFISDAAGCCSQGIEFETAKKLKYPDDFPEDGKDILVTGIFEKYTEDGKFFCRLKDSEMTVLEKEKGKE